MAGLVTGASRDSLYPASTNIRRKSCRRRSTAVTVIGFWDRLFWIVLAFDLEIFVSPGGYICGEERSAWLSKANVGAT